jgi:WXXGXW repeat (2 copies)
MRIISSSRSLLFAFVMLAMSAPSFAQVRISITIAPPALPVYEQPLCPGEGYLWTPGYWAYDYDGGDYYWVPGTWVLAPEVGFLWTPGYWAWGGDRFVFYDGYWGPRVGFYGGVVYGFGYFGEGYEGGRWEHERFFYNRSVNNVNITEIHNVYNTTVINNTTVNRVSYNGGNGGINRRPTSQEEAVAHERHIPPVAVQTQHVQAARANPQLRASANQGKPPVAATPKPGALNDRGVVPAKQAGGPYEPPANPAGSQPPRTNTAAARPENSVPRPPTAVHPKDLPPHSRPSSPNTGNPKLDQKYQQQQEKLYAKQEQDHQKLQQKQEQDHQQLARQRADEARSQQVEQRHQQQTQQLEQRHADQQQKLQVKQQSKPPKRQ